MSLYLNRSLLRSNPFERPMQIFTDFKKTSALGYAIQKSDFGGPRGVVPPDYVKIVFC